MRHALGAPLRALAFAATLGLTSAAAVAAPALPAETPPGLRTIEFSGALWGVRAGGGAPGNGCWSDSPQSVWVDAAGRLHLRLRQVGGRWCQAEVFALRPARHGRHSFRVRTLRPLDSSAVVGLFLYREEPATAGACPSSACSYHPTAGACICEIDVELTAAFAGTRCAGGTVPGGVRAMFTVQPGASERSCASFPVDTTRAATYSFDWRRRERSGVRFDARSAGRPVGQWTYRGPANNFPDTVAPLAVINLWACAWGEACDGTVGAEQELIVESYAGPLAR